MYEGIGALVGRMEADLDHLLRPINRAATRRLLLEARAKVWRNAIALDRARRVGDDRYVELLADLEARCAARLDLLIAPGPVLLKLARRGFGVLLAEPDAGVDGAMTR